MIAEPNMRDCIKFAGDQRAPASSSLTPHRAEGRGQRNRWAQVNASAELRISAHAVARGNEGRRTGGYVRHQCAQHFLHD
jgi:hypothetical protein